MQQTTILGKKSKNEISSDFTPEESDTIIINLAESIKTALQKEMFEEYVYDGARIKKIKVTAKDGSVKGQIIYVPVDTFGEQNAEIRVALSVNKDNEDKHPIVKEAIEGHDFAVKVSE